MATPVLSAGTTVDVGQLPAPSQVAGTHTVHPIATVRVTNGERRRDGFDIDRGPDFGAS
jgi:hypothetical protein